VPDFFDISDWWVAGYLLVVAEDFLESDTFFSSSAIGTTHEISRAHHARG
jgi:hypothetical protein